MSGSGDGYRLRDSGAVSWTGKVMVAAIIVLFVAVVFVIFLHLYAKWFWRRNGNASPRRRHFVFNADGDPDAAARRGLDIAVLNSLPVVTFRSADFEEGFECSVCLCELADGEKARLLPKCNHGFHLECIDMWFHSHSTCPLCRCMVGSDRSPASATMEMPTHAAGEGLAAETVAFPTNVLFGGRQEGEASPSSLSSSASSSSSSSATLSSHIVIDISRPAVDIGATDAAFANVSPSSGRPVEEMKSPASRLHSLKRLLSREGRLAIPISPRGGGDVERGEAMKASSGS